jgi:hypothetical protein
VRAGKNGLRVAHATRAEVTRQDARHARRDQRRKRHDQHVDREHERDGGQGLRPDEMAQEQGDGDGQKTVHAHHENDRQRGPDVNRAERPGQERIGLGWHDPVFLSLDVAQGVDGARITIRAICVEDDKDQSLAELHHDGMSAGGGRLRPDAAVTPVLSAPSRGQFVHCRFDECLTFLPPRPHRRGFAGTAKVGFHGGAAACRGRDELQQRAEAVGKLCRRPLRRINIL